MKKSLRNFGLVALITGFLYFLLLTDSGDKLTHTSVDDLVLYFRSFGAYAVLIGVFAILLQTFIPFSPFIFLAAANVLFFGFTVGLIINYFASCLGAYLAFLFARYIGRGWVEKKLARFTKINQFNKRMETEGFFFILLGRLVSFFPSSIVNYGGGVSKIKMLDYIGATLIGKFPIVLMKSIIAHDLQNWQQYRGRVFLILGLLILLILLGNWLRKSSLRKQN